MDSAAASSGRAGAPRATGPAGTPGVAAPAGLVGPPDPPADAHVIIAALSDEQIRRAFGHVDRARAVTELAQQRRNADAQRIAAPGSPAGEDFAWEGRELSAVLHAVAGPTWRRWSILRRASQITGALWVLSIAAVVIAFWRSGASSPGSASAVGGSAAGLSVIFSLAGLTGLAVIASAALLFISAGLRVFSLIAADRQRRLIIATTLQWASRRPGRLARRLDTPPLWADAADAADDKLLYAPAIICFMLALLTPIALLDGGFTAWGLSATVVIVAVLSACDAGILIGRSRMTRRARTHERLLAALSHPSNPLRLQTGLPYTPPATPRN